MSDRDVPDDLFNPCPPCGPVPWPKTAEEAHTIAVIYVVTWTLGLGCMIWKERDGFWTGLILARYLFLRCIRSMRIALRHRAEGQDVREPQLCKPRERE